MRIEQSCITIGIAQTKIFRDPVAGAMHATIFWGFMVLTAGTVEILIQGVFRGFSAIALLLPKPIYMLYSLSQDGFAVLVLGAIGFAFFRRLVLHPKRLEGDKLEHTDALIILSMIGGLMVTLLLDERVSVSSSIRARSGRRRSSRAASAMAAMPLVGTTRPTSRACSGGRTRC